MLRRLEIAGNPYIGVFCAANDELLIVAPDVPKSAIRHIVGALDTTPIVTSVGHSTVVGSLLALNSKGILASPFIEEEELDRIGDAVYPLPIDSARWGTTSSATTTERWSIQATTTKRPPSSVRSSA